MLLYLCFFTVSEFWTAFREDPMYDPSKAMFEREASRCFDGTWAAGLALNCTDAKLKEVGEILLKLTNKDVIFFTNHFIMLDEGICLCLSQYSKSN